MSSMFAATAENAARVTRELERTAAQIARTRGALDSGWSTPADLPALVRALSKMAGHSEYYAEAYLQDAKEAKRTGAGAGVVSAYVRASRTARRQERALRDLSTRAAGALVSAGLSPLPPATFWASVN